MVRDRRMGYAGHTVAESRLCGTWRPWRPPFPLVILGGGHRSRGYLRGVIRFGLGVGPGGSAGGGSRTWLGGGGCPLGGCQYSPKMSAACMEALPALGPGAICVTLVRIPSLLHSTTISSLLSSSSSLTGARRGVGRKGAVPDGAVRAGGVADLGGRVVVCGLRVGGN